MSYNFIYDNVGDNNLGVPTNDSRSFIRKESWLQSFLASINIPIDVNNNAPGIYPIELRMYSPHWIVDLDQGQFRNVNSDTVFLIWHPRQGYYLNLKENNIFESLHRRFPNNEIRFTFGSVNRPEQLPNYVNYYHFDFFQWETVVNTQKIGLNKNKESTKDFLFLNGRFRPHRAIMYYDLFFNSKLTNSISSFNGHSVYDYSYSEMIEWIKLDSIDKDIEFVERIKSPHFYSWLSSIDNDITKDLSLSQQMYTVDLYDDVYLDLISETFFDSNNNVFITEKTYRAIAKGCIFLICGQAGTLAHLKTQGFKTFNDLFDESYDDCQSWSDRWHIIKQNIDLWSSMDSLQKKEYYQKSFDKLVHNQNLLYIKNYRADVEQLFKIDK
jgi:hypothetical protein